LSYNFSEVLYREAGAKQRWFKPNKKIVVNLLIVEPKLSTTRKSNKSKSIFLFFYKAPAGCIATTKRIRFMYAIIIYVLQSLILLN
jgi:hypothetical protein